MAERINTNLILMNLRMIYFENLPEIMKRWMPGVRQVRIYCRTWVYTGKLPPSGNREAWKGIEIIYTDQTLEELKAARAKAIEESDPLIPTICLLECPVNISKEKDRKDEEIHKEIPWEVPQKYTQELPQID